MRPLAANWKTYPIALLLGQLDTTARASARYRMAPRRPGGATVRPGRATPLWNALVDEVRPWLKVRGEKAQLARLLGVHRQAVNAFFVARTRMPDAERVLLLQAWLKLRRAGKRPAW